ncbi:MAG: HAMP domain-containing sensor histidine kinase [Patescibacteria group bacterium]
MTPLAFSQVHEGTIVPARTDIVRVVDIVSYLTMFILAGIIAWLSVRESNKSKIVMRDSERILKTERNALEKRISMRTRALIKAEEKNLAELERNAEFGKLSQGLFHDLMSPLSSISLYSETLKDNLKHSENTQEIIHKIVSSSKRMGAYMESVKKIVGQEHDSDKTTANVAKELEIVHDVLAYKARMADVKIIIEPFEQTMLNIHPVRLHQLFLNLISNAIDACAPNPKNHENKNISEKTEHEVIVSVKKKFNSIILSVEDNGCGISPENLNKVFKYSFTTKANGTGMGLVSVRYIVENDLEGTVEVESELGRWTKFIVRVPNKPDVEEGSL